MSNSVAEAYLLIVRESNVPIFGEAVPMPFTGQIELDGWSWEIKNKEWEKEKERQAQAELDAKGGTGTKGAKGSTGGTGSSKSTVKDDAAPFKPDGLIRQVTEMQVRTGLTQKERDKRVQELIKKAVAGYAEAASDSGDEDAGKEKDKDPQEKGAMVLKFEKGVDLASTSLLYALARGEILPKAVLTLFHRAKNAPVTLVITMGDIRLTSYEVSCDPDEKMSDLKEKWEATYQTLDWMYQNRPAAAGPNFLTQGTVRVFVMGTETIPV